MSLFRSLWPALLLTLCDSQSCTWLDHPTNTALREELLARSRKGLALAKFPALIRPLPPEPSVELRHFDGKEEVLHLACCTASIDRAISRNRILIVDQPPAPTLDPLRHPKEYFDAIN